MRWIERGDIDGFFGLALDNLVQLLLINSLCLYVLGFPEALLYGRVLPGVAVSLLLGNLYYGYQAKKLARETGRDDVCALPYGINTLSLIAHVFLVMLPVKAVAEANGASPKDAAELAWQAGLVACFGSGLIEFGGAFIAEKIRKATPRAALLSTLSGIALGFISLGFLFRTFAHPIIGLATLAIILMTYFGRVRFKGGLPGGLVAVMIGTALCWGTGIAPVGSYPTSGLSLHFPVPVLGDLWNALTGSYALTYISVIIPMGIFNVVGSLQNIESAEAAGDTYPTAPSLAVNGLGTLAAAIFGSCFPTTIYIGHPGWKAMGARAGYSILNGVAFTLVVLSGALAYVVWAIPVDAGMAIVLWIGIVITAQAFQAVPKGHAPAVVVGLLPGVAAWGVLMAKTAMRASADVTDGTKIFNPAILDIFRNKYDLFLGGGFALEQGFIFTAMLLASITVFVIERRFFAAAFCCLIAASLSAVGLMHQYKWTAADTVLDLKPAWEFALGYVLMAVCFASAKWTTDNGKLATGH